MKVCSHTADQASAYKKEREKILFTGEKGRDVKDNIPEITSMNQPPPLEKHLIV